jgi:uroporphyrinogen-III synthase
VITRPLDEARKLADELRACGREVILAPVLEIRQLDFDPSPPDPIDGLIVTSVNGADALARLEGARDIPVWAVGAATGGRARAVGCSDVRDGAGTASELLESLKSAFGTESRRLLWLSGEDIRVDLGTAFAGQPVEIERRVAYAAVQVERFDAPLSATLRATQEADIVFFSPRSARRFVRVLGETVGLPHISGWRAVCLSRSIADALVEETALAQAVGSDDAAVWSAVTAADAPTKDALLTALSESRAPNPTRSDRDGHDEEGDGRMTEKDNSSVTGADPDKIETDAESVTGAAKSSGPWSSDRVSAGDTVAADSGDDSLIGGDGNDRVDEIAQDDSADDDTAPRATPAKSGGGSRFLITVILIALIGVGVYTTYPVWRPFAVPYAEQFGLILPEIEATEASVSAPEQTASTPATAAPSVPDSTASTSAQPTPPKVTETPTPAPKPAATQDELAKVTARLDDLTQEMAALKAAPAPVASPDPAMAGRLSDLESEIAEIKSTLSTFGDELAILRDNLGGESESNGIGPLAADLSAKLADMGARLQTLETTTPTQAVSPEELAKLSGSVSELSGRLDQVVEDEGAARAALSSKLDGIEVELTKLGTAISNTRSDSEQAGAFLIAANQLALASSRSGGFSAELEAAAVSGSDIGSNTAPAIETLKALSGGVPSRTVLRDRYPSVATAIMDAGLVGSSDSFLGAALRNVAALVSVRRTTTTGGDSLDELVTSAENAIRAGDLQAAVDTLSRLEGDPAAAAADWLAAAQSRLAVDQAVGVLQSAAIANISGG